MTTAIFRAGQPIAVFTFDELNEINMELYVPVTDITQPMLREAWENAESIHGERGRHPSTDEFIRALVRCGYILLLKHREVNFINDVVKPIDLVKLVPYELHKEGE